MSHSALSEDGESSLPAGSDFHDGQARTPGGGLSSANGTGNNDASGTSTPGGQHHKVASPDTVHLPIIHIDCDSPAQVDKIIAALARGEVFIPHMSVLPESLSVNGISPPDLVVRFGCERNDDVPPDEWPNWCLEFMHNQLYEYFAHAGARWTRRPFQITLARKVRWRTVKHMNRFFAHSERVINGWRERGPQYLDPQLSYIEGGATPEEVARPHGIYLLRNGRPTNYFAPNFEPPYTTKMTRSLLLNVIGKSWDKKRRDWSSQPIPRLVTPAVLLSTVCGCAVDPSQGGFLASEATRQISPVAANHSIVGRAGSGSFGATASGGVSAEYEARQRQQEEEIEAQRAYQHRKQRERERQEQLEREEQEQRAGEDRSHDNDRDRHRGRDRGSRRRSGSRSRERSLEWGSPNEGSSKSHRREDSHGSGSSKSHRRHNSHGSGSGSSVPRDSSGSRDSRRRSRSRSHRRRHSRDDQSESSQEEEEEEEPLKQEQQQQAAAPTRRERLKNRLHGRHLSYQQSHSPRGDGDGVVPPPMPREEDATPLIKNSSKEFMRSSSMETDDGDDDTSNLRPMQPFPEGDEEGEEPSPTRSDYHSRRPEPLQLDEPAPLTGLLEPVSPGGGNASEPEGTPEAATPERTKKLGPLSGDRRPFPEAGSGDRRPFPEAATPERKKKLGAASGGGRLEDNDHRLESPGPAPHRLHPNPADTPADSFSFDAFGSTGYSDDSIDKARNNTSFDSFQRRGTGNISEDTMERAMTDGGGGGNHGIGQGQDEGEMGGIFTPPRLRPRFGEMGRGRGSLGEGESAAADAVPDFGSGAISSPSSDGYSAEEPTTPLNYAGEPSLPLLDDGDGLADAAAAAAAAAAMGGGVAGGGVAGGGAATSELLSVGESHTTVPIMNSSPGKFIERERQRRKEREKEREKERRKMEKLERALEEQEKVKSSTKDTRTNERKKIRSGSSKGGEGTGDNDMENKMALIAKATADAAAETERARAAVEEMQRRQQEEQENTERQQQGANATSPARHPETSKSSRRRQGQASPSSGSSSHPLPASPNLRNQPRSSHFSPRSSSKAEDIPEIDSNNSMDTMEYSLESGMLGMPRGGGVVGRVDSTGMGGDKSVVSTATNEDGSLLSYVTRSTMLGVSSPSMRKGGGGAGGRLQSSSGSSTLSPRSSSTGQQRRQEKIDEGDEVSPKAGGDDDIDDDDISLSLLESESSLDDAPVPSDEELFAFGWAKALDPNSGSYYFYTLDRAETVWDNPLVGDGGSSVEAESPPGAALVSSASASSSVVKGKC